MAMGVATLLRVSLFMATCAVWVIAEAQQEDDVIPEWLFANSGEDEEEATNIMISTRKPKPGWVKGGTSCLNTDECGRGKCCLRRNRSPRRRCRRLQRIGEHCTEEQMMGGYYYGHCPCNKNGVCTYTGDGMRCVPKKEEKPPAPEVPPPQVPAPHPTPTPNERPGQKTDSQESEETTGKPGGQTKPSDDATGNELPELPFESLRGPGAGSNVIPPLISHGSGRHRPGSGGRPVGPGQPANPMLEGPSPQSPTTNSASGPSTPTQGAPMPSTLPTPTPPGNPPPQFEGSPNSLPRPPISSGNNGLPLPTRQAVRPPGVPVSPPVLPSAEQKPSQFPSPPPPATSDNELPPIVDERGPPPPLPPSPIDLMNGGLPAQE